MAFHMILACNSQVPLFDMMAKAAATCSPITFESHSCPPPIHKFAGPARDNFRMEEMNHTLSQPDEALRAHTIMYC